MYYVYIIQSQLNGQLYKGSTEDIKFRLKDHNNGRVRSTKAYKPWKIIYIEIFINKSDALKEERFLKSGKGKGRIKFLLQNTMEGWPSG